MSYRDAKYRRRIRQKTEEDKRKAERERHESTQDAHIEKIVASVEELVEQINRYTDEESPHNRSKRCWEKAEVVGLWAAAIVGIVAIVVGSWDSDSTRRTMIKQTSEMESAREQSVTDERARFAIGQIKLIPGSETESAEISYSLINMGKTPATISALSSECSIISKDDISPFATYDPAAARVAINAVGGNATFDGGVDSPCKIIDISDDHAAVLAGTKVYYIKGFVTFGDVFGRIYTQRFAAWAGIDGLFYPILSGLYSVETWDNKPDADQQEKTK